MFALHEIELLPILRKRPTPRAEVAAQIRAESIINSPEKDISVQGLATTAPDNSPPVEAATGEAFSMEHISPFAKHTIYLFPPAFIAGDVEVDANNQLTVQGMPLATSAETVTEYAKVAPQLSSSGPYGDAQTPSFIIPAGGSIKILNRPAFTRIMLQIQNKDPANSINYAFGRQASANDVQISAGQSTSYLEAVPQNEVWVFSTAGAAIAVIYIDSYQPSATYNTQSQQTG